MKYLFEITIKPGLTEEEYIKAWEKGSKIIQASSDEAEGTILYKTDEPGVFIAIASWKSREGRVEAMKKLEGVDEETRKIIDAHRNFADMKKIGYIEEVSSVKVN